MALGLKPGGAEVDIDWTNPKTSDYYKVGVADGQRATTARTDLTGVNAQAYTDGYNDGLKQHALLYPTYNG